jgi:hypothetical protein
MTTNECKRWAYLLAAATIKQAIDDGVIALVGAEKSWSDADMREIVADMEWDIRIHIATANNHYGRKEVVA